MSSGDRQTDACHMQDNRPVPGVPNRPVSVFPTKNTGTPPIGFPVQGIRSVQAKQPAIEPGEHHVGTTRHRRKSVTSAPTVCCSDHRVSAGKNHQNATGIMKRKMIAPWNERGRKTLRDVCPIKDIFDIAIHYHLLNKRSGTSYREL